MTQKQIQKKKQKALDYFTKRLLASPVKKDIKKIVLFGSLARGDVDEYSDIDVLLFTAKPKKVRDVAWDASVDTYAKYEESVESLLYPPKKLKNPTSYFLYCSINNGKHIYP